MKAPDRDDLFSVQLTVRSIEYVGSHYIVEGVDNGTTLRAHLGEERLAGIPGKMPGTKCWFNVSREKMKVLPE
jgi:hypothetical protein